jgi:hypothetical protein
MQIILLFAMLVLALPPSIWAQPIKIDTVLTNSVDTDSVFVQIPENYSPANPPAIVVWWHGLGGSHHDLEINGFADPINQRGWIAACHVGPNDRHWNTRVSQEDCRTMLDWIMQHYPFSMDSIYMVGPSMGAAGGFIWHNNNCGISDYLLAGSAGGSPILDCELRQHQYLDAGHINNAMIAAFGGIPDTSAAVDFEYHRYSAVHFADTTQSMHFNGLHLACYATWGTSDTSYLSEWVAYGRPCQNWDTLRRADNADTTLVFCSGINGHGGQVMTPDSILAWLSGFSVNRFPRNLSINADESDEYYWTRVTMADTEHTFGRYGAGYDWGERRLDIDLIRNIAAIDIEFAIPWWGYDSLRGNWINRDSVTVPWTTLRFTDLPTAVIAVQRNGAAMSFAYSSGTMTMLIPPSGNYTVLFDPLPRINPVPRDVRIEAAYPNPFNSEVTLDIESGITIPQEIRLYDITGRLARTLTVNLQPGTQHISLSGDGLASGVYFVILAKSTLPPVKIVLLK